MRRLSRLAAAAAASILLTPLLPAAECPAIDPPAGGDVVCPAIDVPGGAGLRVFRDRRTGRFRAPTPEEARALYEARGKAIESLQPFEVVVHPNGMRSVDLKGAFAFDVILTRRPDGSVTARCVPADRAPAEEK